MHMTMCWTGDSARVRGVVPTILTLTEGEPACILAPPRLLSTAGFNSTPV